ncbi:MAG: hypothetical protein ACHP7N_00035 [Caulobacterales bacterium]
MAPKTPTIAPPTAQQISLAKAKADQIIAQAGAAAAFSNVTTGAWPTVRHRLSGAYCSFPDNPRPRIVLGPHDSATCEEPADYWVTFITVSRAPPGATSDSELAKAVAVERTEHVTLVPASRPASVLPLPAGRRPPGDPEAWLNVPGGADVMLIARVQNGWVYQGKMAAQPKIFTVVEDQIADFIIDSVVNDPQVPASKRPK